jgi:D-alanyl-D-alanine carboxypeptidase
LTRTSRVGSGGRCARRFAIRARNPRERSCACKARSSAAGRLRLTRTALPAAGQRSIKGPLAHGYREIDGKLVDVNLDPSFAGAAGGYALATTVRDLARFLDTLLAGRLFRHRATLRQMLTIAPAQGEGGLVGYGLGIEQRALPGGPTLIGHLGGAVYRSYVGRLHPTGATIALAMNAEDDPTPLLLPAVKALLATRR